jgi:hypothetical protein
VRPKPSFSSSLQRHCDRSGIGWRRERTSGWFCGVAVSFFLSKNPVAERSEEQPHATIELYLMEILKRSPAFKRGISMETRA